MTSPWESVQRFLGRESMLLDSRRWDEWLELYAPDCEYWLPAWKSDGTLVTDPKTELSLIYYASRAGLEARVLRVRSGRSAASTPAPRTAHVSQLLELSDGGDRADRTVRASSSWTVSSVLEGRVATHFGHADYLLRPSGDSWRIAAKKTIVMNDVIHEVLDFYAV